MKISNNLLVAVDYKLFVKNDDGSKELMEETEAGQPLKFFFGMGMMLQKFEDNLEGLAIGDTFDFMIPCAEAYGEYDDESVIDLPRQIFEVNGKFNEKNVFPGAIVPLVDSEGQRINAEVVEVKPDAVTVDLNHPLSGEDLYFEGKVVDVHEPTEADLRAMSHGCGGCGGCGGNCENGCQGCGE